MKTPEQIIAVIENRRKYWKNHPSNNPMTKARADEDYEILYRLTHENLENVVRDETEFATSFNSDAFTMNKNDEERDLAEEQAQEQALNDEADEILSSFEPAHKRLPASIALTLDITIGTSLTVTYNDDGIQITSRSEG